jgi:hypothetical protein
MNVSEYKKAILRFQFAFQSSLVPSARGASFKLRNVEALDEAGRNLSKIGYAFLQEALYHKSFKSSPENIKTIIMSNIAGGTQLGAGLFQLSKINPSTGMPFFPGKFRPGAFVSAACKEHIEKAIETELFYCEKLVADSVEYQGQPAKDTVARIGNANDGIRFLEQLAEELGRWIAGSEFRCSGVEVKQFRKDYTEKPYIENYVKYLERQYWIFDIINTVEFNQMIEWLKRYRPKIGKDLEKQRKKINSEFETVLYTLPNTNTPLKSNNDKLISTVVRTDEYAEELAKSAQNIAHVIRQESKADRANIIDEQKKDEKPQKPKYQHSEDYTSVEWLGKKYNFTKTQALCVRYLWTEWEKGEGFTLSEKTIGEKISSASDNYKLKHTFRVRHGKKYHKHPAWGTMIVSCGKGVFCLKSSKK